MGRAVKAVTWGGVACAVGLLGWLLLRWAGGGQESVEVAVVGGLAALCGYGLGWGWACLQERKPAVRPVLQRELLQAEVIWDFTGSDGWGYRVVRVKDRMMLWKEKGDRWWVSSRLEEVLREMEAMTAGVGR